MSDMLLDDVNSLLDGDFGDDRILKQIARACKNNEVISAPIKRVTGIGGLFFKTEDPKKIKEWYQKHLGFNVDEWGCTFWWKDTHYKKASTQWSPFKKDTDYFEPSQKEFMLNFRVENLEELAKELVANGVVICDEIATYDYGKFLHIMDNDGNKIELWEPVDIVFTNEYVGKTTK